MRKSDHFPVFVTSLMDDIEPTLLEFIRTNVNSFIKWDLIRFFYENRYTTGTAENIAQYAGRKIPGVERELEDLVGSGVIVRRRLDGIPIYLLGRDEEMWALMGKFVLACEHRDFRVKVVYQIHCSEASTSDDG